MNFTQAFHVLIYALVLHGCQPTHLIYAQDTSVGVDVGLRPDETSGRVMIGYDRDAYALVPRTEGVPDGDAMTLTSVSCVELAGVDKFHFNQFIATGTAGKSIAKDNQALKQIRAAVFGGGEQICNEK